MFWEVKWSTSTFYLIIKNRKQNKLALTVDMVVLRITVVSLKCLVASLNIFLHDSLREKLPRLCGNNPTCKLKSVCDPLIALF